MASGDLDKLLFDVGGRIELGGSPNAYTATTARAITGYFQGLRLCGKASFSNTGAATLNINGIGAAAIRKSTSIALVAGDMVSGQYYDFVYDFANGWFQILNPNANSGLADGSVTTAKIADDAVTYAKIQNVSATSRFLGRITAGSGDTEELTGTEATTLLDAFTSGLKGLAPASGGGTANFLRADATWAVPPGNGGITTIASGSLPAASSQNITNIPATYAYLILRIAGASSNTASRQPWVRVSTDNGSSFDTTFTNYIWIRDTINLSGATFSTAVNDSATGTATMLDTASQTAASTFSGDIYIYGYQGGPWMEWRGFLTSSASSTTYYRVGGVYIGSTSAINALRLLWNGSGNFDAGTYALYGVS